VRIALGSNLGDREAALSFARRSLLRVGVEKARFSSIYESAPVGPPGQQPYLNQVARGLSALAPLPLLGCLKGLERAAGRRGGVRWGPRPLDCDLLDWDGRQLDTPWLELPHPRLHLRRFVLVPLGEVEPGWRHPVLGRSAAELLAALPAGGGWVRAWRSQHLNPAEALGR
jgi:2-amino-4-hydroxy-6-hydroxymethyldihydropteridine diphosphokinase